MTLNNHAENNHQNKVVDKNLTGGYKDLTGLKKGGVTKNKTKKKKNGRPKNPPLKLSINHQKPMPDAKEEYFADLRARKVTLPESYQLAINPKSIKISAGRRASELCKRPDLAARIKYLQATKYPNKQGRPPSTRPDTTQQAPPAVAPEQPPQTPGDQTLLITQSELNLKISQAVRQAVTATEKTQAVKLARDMLGLDKSDDIPVDPVALIQYIATAAGRTAQDIASQAGGLRHMLEAVADYSKVSPSTLRRTLAAWHRELKPTPKDTVEDTQAPDTQADKHLLSDGQSDNTANAMTSTTPAQPVGRGEGDQDGGECYI